MRSYSACSASASVQPERAREHVPRGPVLRQLVGLQVANDLQAVFQRAQEPVRVGERGGVGFGHVSTLGERGQRAERVRLAEPMVTPAVDDLQELDGELDVADPAAAALHLGELLAPGPDVLLEPHLDAADVIDRGLVQLPRVDERRRRSTNARPTAWSPATALALIMACRSHVAARCS